MLKHQENIADDSHEALSGELFGVLINLSGRQRMLSQRLILHAVLAKSGQTGALETAEEALQLFRESHEKLTVRQIGYPGLFSKALQNAFYGSLDAAQRIELFIDNATLALRAIHTGQQNSVAFENLVDDTTPILKLLNEITSIYENESKLFSEETQKSIQENQRQLKGLMEEVVAVVREARVISMNARVVAAKAGPIGAKFDVVATELGRLTERIDNIVKTVLSRIREDQE